MMKKFILIIFLIVCQFNVFSQTKIYGLYEQTGFTLDLRTNQVCIMHSYPDCATGGWELFNKYDTTTWSSSGDTIIVKTDKEYLKRYLFKSKYLLHLNYSDSVLKVNDFINITDHYFISYPELDRIYQYYENGNILSRIQTFEDKKIETVFYVDGKIMSISQYLEDEKYGDWITFDKAGNIINLTTYQIKKKKKGGFIKQLFRN